jgi:hypothetical protein
VTIDAEFRIRLAIRGFASGKRQFEELIEINEADIDSAIPQLALKHADALTSHALHMIEIEFLDEPDENERFFRFGTDPSGMVIPMAVQL